MDPWTRILYHPTTPKWSSEIKPFHDVKSWMFSLETWHFSFIVVFYINNNFSIEIFYNLIGHKTLRFGSGSEICRDDAERSPY